MRYYLDLGHGPLVECEDAHQAASLGSLWLTAQRVPDPLYHRLIAVRIRAIAAVGRGTIVA
ncbi:MAG TPA: hypothetical protein DGD08_01900 [Gemmatimonas aurantiaca]|uniref:Uncharacterized protein n=2 Tax=Gemmatimonas aurantiaca TaxID=173480 RepID=C1AAR1_GEMAT|nr:hypothetical protein [Gemmatimonas aurantiaca]BAH39317.1 hypothetical protein GAU_2275 [Gemmatimonas aurantiaca T-27]HCT55947.1 hypothetical protein [Gemmatimonas aurantiaca]